MIALFTIDLTKSYNYIEIKKDTFSKQQFKCTTTVEFFTHNHILIEIDFVTKLIKILLSSYIS